jgi:hypothetical protein
VPGREKGMDSGTIVKGCVAQVREVMGLTWPDVRFLMNIVYHSEKTSERRNRLKGCLTYLARGWYADRAEMVRTKLLFHLFT